MKTQTGDIPSVLKVVPLNKEKREKEKKKKKPNKQTKRER